MDVLKCKLTAWAARSATVGISGGPGSTIVLWYVHPSHRRRKVAASRCPIARYSERHPRQRCGARPKTRKKFSVRPGGFLNLHSQHRFPAPSLGSAAFRQLACGEKECQGAAQALLSTPMIIRQAWTEYPSISCLLRRGANSRLP